MTHTVGRFTFIVMLLLVLSLVLPSFHQVIFVHGASSEVVITSDGSVVGTDKIRQNGDIYTFTDNINGTINVQKQDVVIDGGGYALFGNKSLATGIFIKLGNITVRNLQVSEFAIGIHLRGVFYCSLVNNNITECSDFGIKIERGATSNSISGNIITNCKNGLAFSGEARKNVLRNNVMKNNTYNFGYVSRDLLCTYFDPFVNDVDSSNLVNGKPIYYWVDKSDLTVPSDAGYVALVNCDNITVENLDLSGNKDGVLLVFTNNSKLENNTITNCLNGIQLECSEDNRVVGNRVINNSDGIVLYEDSMRNRVFGNLAENNSHSGVATYFYAKHNFVYGNTVKNNTIGLYVYRAQSNSYDSNMIVDNKENAIECTHMPCENNSFSENFIKGNGCGIYIPVPSQEIVNNTITRNNYGIVLRSTGNLLRSNVMQNNNYNFDGYIDGMNDVDRSNLVDGRPIYYLVNQQNLTAPADAGYLALINCVNITVEDFVFSNNGHCLFLINTVNSKIIGNRFAENDVGVQLYKSSNNTISDNNFNEGGISLSSSLDNNIFENSVIGKGFGIVLSYSSNNAVTNNNLTYTYVGITLQISKNNTLRNNFITHNLWNFKVEGEPTSNDVDTSNLVDGKPIYYWVNKTDKAVPSDAGYVCLVHCDNIVVQNCTLVDNQQGVLLAFTSNCTITNNNITSNTLGIQLYDSSGINVTRNSITDNWFGIEFWRYSYRCEVLENYIVSNDVGVYFASVGTSTFLANSFVNNTQQIVHYNGEDQQKLWDNGSTGNYWSNYNGTDADSDGIGDTAYVINNVNQDYYPLMKPVDLAIIPEFSSWLVLVFFVVVFVFGTKIGRRLK